jgi:hypothetical protein
MRSLMIAISFLAAAGSASAQDADLTASCVQSYTSEGSFFTGHTYRLRLTVPQVDQTTAMQRIAQAITAARGYRDVRADPFLGTVSAAQQVHGSTATVPLNVTVRPREGGGVEIESAMTTNSGQVASRRETREDVCAFLTAAGR